MNNMAEMVQDVGLAQSIQNGLPKSQMSKPKFPDPPTLQAKKDAVNAGAKLDVYKSELGKWLLQSFAVRFDIDLSKANASRRFSTFPLGDRSGTYKGGEPTEESLASYWDGFQKGIYFETYCKYMCLKETIQKESITPKLFEEMRPLGMPS